MAVRSTNTYQEGLQSLIQDVASMMLTADADTDFLKQLQELLIAEAQKPLQAQAAATLQSGSAQPLPPPAVPPGGGGGPVLPGGGGVPAGLAALMGQGGPGGGSAPLPPSPAADELRRMMA